MGNPRLVANSKGKKRLPGTRPLYQALKCHDIVFIDFIQRCLHWDPSKRLTPIQALQHEFITNMSTIPSPPKPVTSFLSSQANHNNYYSGGSGVGTYTNHPHYNGAGVNSNNNNYFPTTTMQRKSSMR